MDCKLHVPDPGGSLQTRNPTFIFLEFPNLELFFFEFVGNDHLAPITLTNHHQLQLG